MVTLATSRQEADKKPLPANRVNGFPGENEFKDLQFKLAHNLQSTLDLHTALELFFENIQEAIKVSGLRYEFPENQLNIELGRKCQNKAQYTVSSTQSQLGKITFMRGKRFVEPELATLEMLISVLFFPLRNALMYREALENSMRDTLTGIGNRASMELSFSREIKLSKRHEQPLSILIVDIDHFKQINDTAGHRAGDRMLQHIVRNIQSTLRETDQIFRYGGEEFVILLNNTDHESARLTAERIRMKIAMSPLELEDQNLMVTISVGVSSVRENDNGESLFERADNALYAAKNAGRNKVFCCKMEAS